jgi:hypothetical protein
MQKITESSNDYKWMKVETLPRLCEMQASNHKVWIQSLVRICEICDGQNGIGLIFSPGTWSLLPLSIHQMLHTQYLWTGTGTIGQLLPGIPSELSLTSPHGEGGFAANSHCEIQIILFIPELIELPCCRSCWQNICIILVSTVMG